MKTARCPNSASSQLVRVCSRASVLGRPPCSRRVSTGLANVQRTSLHSRGCISRQLSCLAKSDSEPKARKEKPRSSLRKLPGIGKVNELKLLQKGFDSVESLKKMYLTDCGADQDEAVKFLREHIGIRHTKHCQSIIEFLNRQRSKKLTFCVEGNISAGKSTFLDIVRDFDTNMKKNLQVVPEPVDKWQNVQGGQSYNLLDEYYKSPVENAYLFQTYVFLTRVFQESESCSSSLPFRLMERSVFSDRMVFVRKLNKDSLLSNMQVAVYDNMFQPLVAERPSLVPDGFIYLRAQPGTCMRRMKHRSRGEEAGVPQEYLEGLHENHEDWLCSGDSWLGSGRTLTTSPFRQPGKTILREGVWKGRPEAPPAPASIQGDLKWASAMSVPMVGQSLTQVPVLVLDTDTDLDLERDVEAKRSLSGKVADYFEYVGRLQEEEASCRAASGGLLAASRQEREMVARSMAHPEAAATDMRLQMQREEPGPKVGSLEEVLEQLSRHPLLPAMMRLVASNPAFGTLDASTRASMDGLMMKLGELGGPRGAGGRREMASRAP